MAQNATARAGRFEGRLFSQDGRLYFVIDVDSESGFARVSCRIDGEHQLLQMPISEVGLRLSSSSKLEGISTASSPNRIIEQSDGWFFSTRDGLKGPYLTDTEAGRALDKYLRSVNGATRLMANA